MEETFGPVIGIMKVESDDEALSLMNDSPYGLVCHHSLLCAAGGIIGVEGGEVLAMQDLDTARLLPNSGPVPRFPYPPTRPDAQLPSDPSHLLLPFTFYTCRC
jgi:hypothetical protein